MKEGEKETQHLMTEEKEKKRKDVVQDHMKEGEEDPEKGGKKSELKKLIQKELLKMKGMQPLLMTEDMPEDQLVTKAHFHNLLMLRIGEDLSMF